MVRSATSVGGRVSEEPNLRPGGRSMSGSGGMTPRGKQSFFCKVDVPGAVVFVAPVRGQEVATVSHVCERLLPKVESPRVDM